MIPTDLVSLYLQQSNLPSFPKRIRKFKFLQPRNNPIRILSRHGRQFPSVRKRGLDLDHALVAQSSDEDQVSYEHCHGNRNMIDAWFPHGAAGIKHFA